MIGVSDPHTPFIWWLPDLPGRRPHAPRRGVPPDCDWLLYDIIRTDPERMVDVERSMRDAPG